MVESSLQNQLLVVSTVTLTEREVHPPALYGIKMVPLRLRGLMRCNEQSHFSVPWLPVFLNN